MSKNKPLLNALRPITNEDKEFAKELVNHSLREYQEKIFLFRKKALLAKGFDEVKAKEELLSGKTFSAQDALKHGLVDEIGTFEDF